MVVIAVTVVLCCRSCCCCVGIVVSLLLCCFCHICSGARIVIVAIAVVVGEIRWLNQKEEAN